MTRLFAEPPVGKKAADSSIAELIKQLASNDEATHRAAAKRLETMLEAIPALRKAEASTDLNLHWRAQDVLREALLRRDRRFVDGYPLDVFLERFLRVEDPLEEEAGFRVIAEFTGRLVDAEKRDFKLITWRALSKMAVYDYLKYRKEVPFPMFQPGQGPKLRPTEEFAISFGMCVARRESLQFAPKGRSVNSLLTSPGSVRAGNMNNAVVLAGDRVEVLGPNNSIIIADGDVASADSIKDSIVITRGSVRCQGDIEQSLVLAAGAVKFGKNSRNQDGRNVGSTIRERDPKLLGWVRFFETADAGIEVTVSTGGVTVAKVIDGLPPAKVGLKVGDVITAVDGKAAENPETFRRLLRRGTVLDETKFTVKRDGKDLSVTASFLGWEPPAVKPAK